MANKFALLICNSSYTNPQLNDLIAPNNDVSALANVLSNPEIGQFDKVDILADESSHMVVESIAKFMKDRKRDDLLFLYFSGHGILDENGRLYLATANTQREILRATGISARFITEEMDYSRSKRQVLILDCCHSGAFARGSKGSTGRFIETGNHFQGNGYGRVVVTATDATQYAWEGDSITGEGSLSVFTDYLVDGLYSGEADTNKDGVITINELYEYVYCRVVQRESDKRQTPKKWSFKQEGEISIAKSQTNLSEAVGLTINKKNLNPSRELMKNTFDIIIRSGVMTQSEREAKLTYAFWSDPIRYKIDISGSAFIFVNRLLESLISEPLLEDHSYAIVVLLTSLKDQFGIDVNDRIDHLIEEWGEFFDQQGLGKD